MLPKTAEKRRWYFVHGPNRLTTCVFGILVNNKVQNISARVERERDGKWRWTITNTNGQGLEPDRISAMQTVMDIFALTQEEREEFLHMDDTQKYLSKGEIKCIKN